MRSIALPIIYDKLYKEAQDVLNKHNPCDVQGGVCYEARKRGVKDPNSQHNFCCNGCVHLGPEGCTVESLSCKLWLCGAIRQDKPEVAKEMDVVMRKGREYGFALHIDYFHYDELLRKSKDETLAIMEQVQEVGAEL